MVSAVLWLIAGLLLVAAEVLSGDFVLLMLGAAALGAGGAAALGAPLWLAVAVFGATSVGLTTVARPVLKRRLHAGDPEHATGAQALVGVKAVVVRTVDAHRGRVKLRGEEWSARAYDETEVLEVGRSVTVMDIAGATALVWGGP